ncbi:hypothetical protein [Symmachiella macrocystis]|nr:hypothetical protein [Symmachiella macrocystis]
MSDCVGLMEQYGERYRVTFDPVIDPHGRQRDKIDPILQVLKCRFGEIYPQGGDLLVIELRNHPSIARQLKESGCCQVHQEGEGEIWLLFQAEHFEAVAEIVKPHRRTQISDERRRELAKHVQLFNVSSSIKQRGFDVRINASTSARQIPLGIGNRRFNAPFGGLTTGIPKIGKWPSNNTDL